MLVAVSLAASTARLLVEFEQDWPPGAFVKSISIAAQKAGNFSYLTEPMALQMNLDTTSGSLPHWMADRIDRAGLATYRPLLVYVVAVGATLVPLLIAGWLGSTPISRTEESLKLPFLWDVGMLMLFLVSLPCLLLLTVSDDRLLVRSLAKVKADGIISIPDASQLELISRWNHRFRWINLWAQVIAIISATAAAISVFETALTIDGNWQAQAGKMRAIGYVFVYCNFVFAFITAFYVIRAMAIVAFLRDLVSCSTLHLVPLHPDMAGGLQPVGRLGLRNQYALALLGLNITLDAAVLHYFLGNSSLLVFVAASTVAYIFVGPWVFLGPLLPFRAAMIHNKAQLMSGVAFRMRALLDDMNSRMKSGVITAEDEQSLERLRKFSGTIAELPVWPFDAITLRKFAGAYVAPLLGTVGVWAMKSLFQLAKDWPPLRDVLGHFGSAL